ncbi:MAG: plastocyanin/azurin family copper-binding protein [Actinomycetota bacterium]|nr:plastocyanin/azurin family copper-binding protein [Actinomycetota bacterium]
MRKRFWLLLACCLPIALFGACSDDMIETTEISMTSDHVFDPAFVEGSFLGQEITFVNESDEPHSVTAYQDGLPDGANFFSSGGFDTEQAARDNVGEALIAPGEEFTVTLEEPGTYEYFCIPHEGHGMKGEIQVGE